MIIPYKAEFEIAELLLNNKITYCSEIRKKSSLSETDIQVIDTLKNKASASNKQIDLYPYEALLCSTGFNLNDDFFDNEEVWAARNTPVDKPCNYEHNSLQIVGHHTQAFVVDDSNNLISDSTAVEDLPQSFHVVKNGVIYTMWDEPKMQELVDQVVAGIESGEYFVSLEAWFSSFDFAMLSKSGELKVINRNRATAFLTKHLKAFGGSGEYDGCRIGRLLRNITFGGSGIVKTPANPNSVFRHVTQANTDNTVMVYSIIENLVNGENEMSDELKTAQARIQTLEAQLAETNNKEVQSLKASLAEVTKTNDELKQTLATRNKELNEAKELASNLEKLANEIKGKAEAAEAKLAELDKQHKLTERVAVVKSKLLKSDEEAKTFVESTIALSDEAFQKIVDLSTPSEKTQASKTDVLANGQPVATPTITVASTDKDLKSLSQELCALTLGVSETK